MMGQPEVRVVVTLKGVVLDPQGQAILQVISGMAEGPFESVRQGRVLDLIISAETTREALAADDEVSRTVLSSPIQETFTCFLQ